jgi:amino acid adenylation domain-containing protein
VQTYTPVTSTIPNQIAEQARLQPHLTALHHGDREPSFGNLNHRADRFADYLQRRADVSGRSVAICMERSVDWIVAAIGIMRAGAAYVPLDPAWPDARLRFAVSDSGAVVLVAHTSTLERLRVGLPGIDPFRDAAAIGSSDGTTNCSFSLDSVAYIIYTSGSTGVPKGVEITHANLAHLVNWHRNAFGITPQDRVSHLAGLGFDAAAWEIWPHLCAGATVCIPDDTVRLSPELIQRWMLHEGITIGFVPTVHAVAMMEMAWPESTPLRFLLTGGDALHQGPHRRLPFKVVNNYGPTECTVVATSSVLQPDLVGMPPIGRPIAGTTIYLLDENQRPVPDGSAGEIYIGGAGVGRGYCNLPELTRERFLPDPFAGIPEARIYRTGDRGVLRAGGEIQFLGRLDRQVKIRGQRVELDEIGSVLSLHPSVAFAAAIANGSAGAEKQLLAYVLFKKDANGTNANDLQMHLRESLPDYMIPAVYVRLQQLPVSASGKIDFNLLPPPTDENLLKSDVRSATITPLEDKLLTTMRALLETTEIGLQDNFFLAGGDSLLGMQLIILIRDEFGVELTFQEIFDAYTVEHLAKLIATTRNEERIAAIWEDLLNRENLQHTENFFDIGGNADLLAALRLRIAKEVDASVTIAELFRNPTVRLQAELTHRAARDQRLMPPGVFPLRDVAPHNAFFWVPYLNVNLGKIVGDNQEFVFVALTPEDVAWLGELPTLQSIAAIFVQKILAAQPRGPYMLGGNCAGAILAYEIATQFQAAGHEVSLLVLLDPPGPLYLKSQDAVRPKLTQPRYLLSRAAQMGLRNTLLRSGRYVVDRLRVAFGAQPKIKTKEPSRQMIETAVAEYTPQKYEGRVLLLLASVHPPHVDFLPAWQAAVSGDLHIHYVSGHHNDLMKTPWVRDVAEAIVSHIGPSHDTLSSGSDSPGSRPSCTDNCVEAQCFITQRR